MLSQLEINLALKILNRRRNTLINRLDILLETTSDYPISRKNALDAIAKIDKEWDETIAFSAEKVKAFFLNKNIHDLEKITEDLKNDLKKEKIRKTFEKQLEPLYFSYQKALIERNRLDAIIGNIIDQFSDSTFKNNDLTAFRHGTWKEVESITQTIDDIRKRLDGPIESRCLTPQEENLLKTQISQLQQKNDIAKEIQGLLIVRTRFSALHHTLGDLINTSGCTKMEITLNSFTTPEAVILEKKRLLKNIGQMEKLQMKTSAPISWSFVKKILSGEKSSEVSRFVVLMAWIRNKPLASIIPCKSNLPFFEINNLTGIEAKKAHLINEISNRAP